MTRLTNEMRDNICSRIMTHRFKDDDEKMKLRHAQIALECWVKLFTKKERELIDQIPAGWLPQENSITVLTPQGRHNFYFAGYCTFGDDQIEKPFPDNRRTLSVTHDDARLLNKVNEFVNDQENYRITKTDAKNKIMSVLSSCNTAKSLLATWPEIEEFVRETCKLFRPESRVPMIVTSRLNAELGLPPEEKEAA